MTPEGTQAQTRDYSLTVAEAAALLGSHEKAVERLIFSARVDAIRLKVKKGHEYRLRADEIVERREELRERIGAVDPGALLPIGRDVPAELLEALALGSQVPVDPAASADRSLAVPRPRRRKKDPVAATEEVVAAKTPGARSRKKKSSDAEPTAATAEPAAPLAESAREVSDGTLAEAVEAASRLCESVDLLPARQSLETTEAVEAPVLPELADEATEFVPAAEEDLIAEEPDAPAAQIAEESDAPAAQDAAFAGDLDPAVAEALAAVSGAEAERGEGWRTADADAAPEAAQPDPSADPFFPRWAPVPPVPADPFPAWTPTLRHERAAALASPEESDRHADSREGDLPPRPMGQAIPVLAEAAAPDQPVSVAVSPVPLEKWETGRTDREIPADPAAAPQPCPEEGSEAGVATPAAEPVDINLMPTPERADGTEVEDGGEDPLGILAEGARSGGDDPEEAARSGRLTFIDYSRLSARLAAANEKARQAAKKPARKGKNSLTDALNTLLHRKKK